MATVNWIYGDMWRWFTEVGEDVAYPVDDVIVNIFEANYEVIKFRTPRHGQAHGPPEPFVNRSVQVFKVHATDPMVSAHSGTNGMVQHGMYLVTDAPSASFDVMEKIRRKKNLYVVFPRRIDAIVVADHLSWCVDRGGKGDRAKPVHLHMTWYSPFDPIPGQGSVTRIMNYLPSSIGAVPRDLEAFKDLLITNTSMGPFAGLLRDVMLRPYADAHADTDIASTAGGSQKRAARRRRRRRAAAAAADPHRDQRTPFEQAWFDLPLRKMVVIGVPSAQPMSDPSVHFTAYVYDRMSHPLRGGSLALHFVLGAAAARDEARVTSAIAGLLAGRRWEDFVDVPIDEVY
jgi:hypothetical protein